MTPEQLSHRIRLAQAGSLESWNSFVRELNVPNDFIPAIAASRSELLRAVKPRAMSEEEAKVVFELVAGLIDTNIALRAHAQELATLVMNWQKMSRGMMTVAGQISDFANFRAGDDGEEY